MGSCLSSESRSPIPGSPTSPAKHHRSKNSSKRRYGSRNSSFGDLSLHRIPGRLFANGFTDVASLFTQQGKKGTNQDAMIVWEVCFFFFLKTHFLLLTLTPTPKILDPNLKMLENEYMFMILNLIVCLLLYFEYVLLISYLISDPT